MRSHEEVAVVKKYLGWCQIDTVNENSQLKRTKMTASNNANATDSNER